MAVDSVIDVGIDAIKTIHPAAGLAVGVGADFIRKQMGSGGLSQERSEGWEAKHNPATAQKLEDRKKKKKK